MVKRAAALAVSLLILFDVLTGNVRAQSESAEIDIVVVDTATKQPLELARVLLDGPVVTSELTGKNGKVVFTDVPDGIYRARIVRRGYTSLTSASFEVLDGRVITVSFALAPDTGGLKVIGQVTAKASATISSSSIDAIRRSAASLAISPTRSTNSPGSRFRRRATTAMRRRRSRSRGTIRRRRS